MEKSRRLFLSQFAVLAGGAAIVNPLNSGKKIIESAGRILSVPAPVDIYYTSDLHGHVHPVFEDMGGLQKIKLALATEKPGGLLLDAGGFFSGTETHPERIQLVRLMNSAGYVAVGLSSRELHAGQDALAATARNMNFALINCNHKFTGNLTGVVKSYHIVNSKGVRIGITGVCTPLAGLKHLDPVKSAEMTAQFLKSKERCDFVICLAHLGDSESGLNNQALAAQCQNIDMVIGGGNQVVRNGAFIQPNILRHEVILSQVASHGLMYGHTAISFDHNRQKKSIAIDHILPGVKKSFQSLTKVIEIKAKLAVV